jgi:hypothetical protein
MALRHLIVVNNLHEPVGMITRKDIMYTKLHRYFLENKQSLETATAETMAPMSFKSGSSSGSLTGQDKDKDKGLACTGDQAPLTGGEASSSSDAAGGAIELNPSKKASKHR